MLRFFFFLKNALKTPNIFLKTILISAMKGCGKHHVFQFLEDNIKTSCSFFFFDTSMTQTRKISIIRFLKISIICFGSLVLKTANEE